MRRLFECGVFSEEELTKGFVKQKKKTKKYL